MGAFACLLVAVTLWDDTVRDLAQSQKASDTKPNVVIDVGESVRFITWSRDSSFFLATMENGEIWIIDPALDRGKWRIRDFKNEIKGNKSIVFSPDGTLVCFGTLGGDIIIFDWRLHATKARFHIHEGSVSSVAFSPNGKLMLTSGVDSFVRVINPSNGVIVKEFSGHSDCVCDAAFIGNKFVASAGHDQTLKIWPISCDAKPILLEGHSDSVQRVLATIDNDHLLTASWDRTVRVWSIQHQRVEKIYIVGHEPPRGADVFPGMDRGIPLSICASPSEKTVFCGLNGLIRVWNFDTGKEIRILRHPGEVNAVSCSPNGKLLATGSSDGTIRLWEMDKFSIKGVEAPFGSKK